MSAAFDQVRGHRLEALDIGIDEYRHRSTGAKHFHFAAPHSECVFMVAFQTLPEDSTGVAHVLEHTVLCGSERYPVRDPFFLMIRRSLNTFMNAFTGSDYTAYPFASQNKRDFDNLLGIYLDAVFFPRLDPLDFAQEGHRLEFEDPEDSTTPLVHRGVVYNEMKGDASAPASVAWEALCKHLYSTTTYHYNSGGDPAEIPNLTYADLLAFHKRHYQPANAIFMTFGDRPVEELQDQFDTLALGRFGAVPNADMPSQPAREQRLTAPIRRVETITTGEEGHDDGQVLLGWLLGPNTNIGALMRAEMLSDLLLDTSASPLRAALEQTDLGSAPSILCGLEESNHEMCFVCGLEGTRAEDADAIEALILATLEEVARDGLPQDRVAAVLHQLELHRREIGGDGYPYGLQLMLSALPALLHGGDPIPFLDLDDTLQQLAEDAQAPDFVPGLARELLENPHRVRLTLSPDAGLATAREQASIDALASARSALLPEGVEQVLLEARSLAARQAQDDNIGLLPKVGRADIPAELRVPVGITGAYRGRRITTYAAGTNGIAYEQVVHAMPAEPANLELLSILGACITEVGSAGRGFAETQHAQHAICGGITAYANIRGSRENPADCRGLFVLSSRALQANTAPLAELLEATMSSPDFFEPGRLTDLVRQMRVRRDSGITGNAHGLAMTAAAAAFAPGAALSHRLSGLEGILNLRSLEGALQGEADEAALADRLAAVLEHITGEPRELLLVAEPDRVAPLAETIAGAWTEDTRGFVLPELRLAPGGKAIDQIWLTNTQVSFAAQAHPTVGEAHPDAAALAVLGGVLRNAYLHGAVREQGGAYGVGAGHDASNGVFRFYSYRDPAGEVTFGEFDRSIEWVLSGALNEELVEEAVLQMVSSIDAPASPAGEARSAFMSALHGRDAAARRNVREAILEVAASDLRRVAEVWLGGARSRCMVTGQAPASDRWEVFQI